MKCLLLGEFTIETEGGMKDFLGYEILRDHREATKDCCCVLQPHFIDKLVKNFCEPLKCERKTKHLECLNQCKLCQKNVVIN